MNSLTISALSIAFFVSHISAMQQSPADKTIAQVASDARFQRDTLAHDLQNQPHTPEKILEFFVRLHQLEDDVKLVEASLWEHESCKLILELKAIRNPSPVQLPPVEQLTLKELLQLSQEKNVTLKDMNEKAEQKVNSASWSICSIS